MRVESISRLLAGAILLGTLACTASSHDVAEHQSRRIAEMDRLDQQEGMPDTWQTSNLKAMRAYSAAINRTTQRLLKTGN